MPAIFRKAVILGAGGVGRMLANYLSSCCGEVVLYDNLDRDGARKGDANNPSAALSKELNAADIIILALPARVLSTSLPEIMRTAAQGAVVIETGSVKAHLERSAIALPEGVELLGINPMSAPALGLSQQNVAVIRYIPGERSAIFESCLAKWGAKLVVLTAEKHDRLMAIVQACAHAATLGFGAALCQSKIDIEELASVSTPFFRAMLLLSNRILQQDPHVYWDIQANNPFAHEARSKVAENILNIDRLAADPNGFDAFDTCLESIRDSLRPLRPFLDDGSVRLFAQLAESQNARSP